MAESAAVAGLENTFKAILLKHQDLLSEALEAEKKKEVKFWKICAETMGGPDAVPDLTQFENNPCSHFMVYMRGQCKETIAVRAAELAPLPTPRPVPRPQRLMSCCPHNRDPTHRRLKRLWAICWRSSLRQSENVLSAMFPPGCVNHTSATYTMRLCLSTETASALVHSSSF